jgi:hypothetical protein
MERRFTKWFKEKVQSVRSFDSRDWIYSVGCLTFAGTILGGSVYGMMSEPTNYPSLNRESCPSGEELEKKLVKYPGWNLAELATTQGVSVSIVIRRGDLEEEGQNLRNELNRYLSGAKPVIIRDRSFPISRNGVVYKDGAGNCRMNYVLG